MTSRQPVRIDRSALSGRELPVTAAVGHFDWKNVLFLHWKVRPRSLEPLIPAGLRLHLHRGAAYLGITALDIVGTRPRFVPRPFGLSFPEVDARTYVLDAHGVPGVFYLTQYARSWITTVAGRAALGLPYHAGRVRHEGQRSGGQYTMRSAFSRASLTAGYEVGEWTGVPQEGGLEHFLVQRYFLFSRNLGQIFRMRIDHDPYVLHRARLTEFENGLSGADGLPRLEGAPRVHFSRGVRATVHRPERVGP